MRYLPSLVAVRVFEAAARHENFTKAAVELGMTQAAVSYQISVLEKQLGVSLFTRARQRVSLSEAGRTALPAVSKAFNIISEAFSASIRDDRQILAISTAETFAATWLASRLGEFQIRHPDLAVRLSSDDRYIDFASDPFDVAIRVGSEDWPNVAQHFLFHSYVTPLCSPAFQEEHQLRSPEQIRTVRRLSPNDIWWSSWLRESGVDGLGGVLRPGMALDSQVKEARAAIAGHGIALMTPLFWRAEIISNRLVQPFETLLLPGPSYSLVYPSGKHTHSKIKAFRDWLFEELRKSAVDEPERIFSR